MLTVDEILKVPGQQLPQDIERLQYLGSLVPPGGVMVEIGSFKGQSATALLSAADPTVHLFCIDPWTLEERPYLSMFNTMDTFVAFRQNIMPLQQQITQIVGWPVRVAAHWNTLIDLLFIDAVKEYDLINPIWRAWVPFVKVGGWIASHDYVDTPGHVFYFPGVLRSIAELVKPITDSHHEVGYLWSGRRVRQ